MAIDVSPPAVPVGKLNKDAFLKVVPVLAARVPVTKLGEIRASRAARRASLDLPRTDSIVKGFGPNPDSKLLLLSSDKEEEIDLEGLAFIKERSLEIIPHHLTLTYDFWDANEVLKAVLPEHVVAPAAYTSVGHIIHLNLRAHQLPYKYLIGEVFLSKSPSMRTVVNKTDRIHAQFRYFEMELLAGEPDFVVEVKESGHTFTFDYREVYFNTRLGTEHRRLVEKFSRDDLVCDVMAGVGPFAIPAAVKGCAVMMNDLNPNAVKWAKVNIEKNRVSDLVRVYELDGVDFIRKSVIDVFKRPFPPYMPPINRQQRLAQKRRETRIGQKKSRTPSPEREALRYETSRHWPWQHAHGVQSRPPSPYNESSRSSSPPEPPFLGPSTFSNPGSKGRQQEGVDAKPQYLVFSAPANGGAAQEQKSSEPTHSTAAEEQTFAETSISPPPSSSSLPAPPAPDATPLPSSTESRSLPPPPEGTSEQSATLPHGTVVAGRSVPLSPRTQLRSMSTRSSSPHRPRKHVPQGPERRTPAHYVLNLPTTAILFLFAFRGFLRPIMETHLMAEYYGPTKNMPMIHVYCFTNAAGEDAMKEDILDRASKVLKYPLTLNTPELDLHFVRKVSPTKHGWCLSFRLPWEVAIEDVSEAEIRKLKEDLVKVHEALEDVAEDDEYEEPVSLQEKKSKHFPKVEMV